MKIERCWCSYRDRQMFKLLKYAICAAVSRSVQLIVLVDIETGVHNTITMQYNIFIWLIGHDSLQRIYTYIYT